MKNKTFINIQPQEVTEGGERSVRYKGSDGKLHDITAKQKLPALSIEERRTSVKITVSDLQTSTLTVNEFLMKYQGTEFANFQIINASYTSSSANKIYFANSIKGTFNYYYDLGNSVVEFRDGNTVLDKCHAVITRRTWRLSRRGMTSSMRSCLSGTADTGAAEEAARSGGGITEAPGRVEEDHDVFTTIYSTSTFTGCCVF